MINWILILQLYLASLIGAGIHEWLGHLPKGKIHISLLPMCSSCQNARILGPLSMWSGLATLWLIAYLKPDLLFLQLLGFVMFSHFLLATLISSWAPHKIKAHKNIKGDTEGSVLAFVIRIIVLIYFSSYYIPIGLDILNKLII